MIKAIDFAQLYRDHLARSGRRFKTPEDWDVKAAKMRTSVLDSAYRTEFVSRVESSAAQTTPCWMWAVARAPSL